jgi:capsular exopolysaccharide synthesis family protein
MSDFSDPKEQPAKTIQLSTLDAARAQNQRENDLYEGTILLSDAEIVCPPAAERYRILRAKIERLNLRKENNYFVFAVTSAIAQEGKSVTSVNLSRALSIDPSGKTLLIDCDLRRPTIHKFFNQKQNGGLSDAIAGLCDVTEVIRSVTPRLDIITAGTPISDPTQAIERPDLENFIARLRQTYRYILIDCPPALLCPEPIRLSTLVDATLLVVRAWRTDKRLVNEAVEVVGKSKILGVVMNDGIDVAREYLSYGYYGYRPNTQTPSGDK